MILEILKRSRLIVFSVHWSHAAHIVIFVWSGDIRDIKEISFDCFQCFALVTCSTYSYLCAVW